MFKITTLVALLSIGLSFSTFANDELKQVEENLRKVNNGAFAQAPIRVFSRLEVPGFENLYFATLGGQSLVVDKSGKFAVAGNLINLDLRMDLGAKYMNKALAELAEAEIARLDASDFVTFPAKSETIGQLYVLTDPTCGYCRKLHTEIDTLLAAGIEVKYIPYPRSELIDGQQAFEQTKQIMCASDKLDAMDKIKKQRDSGMFVKAKYEKSCVDNVRHGKQMGNNLAISGTPFLYLSTGDVIPGYQPAEALVEMFKAAQ